ncbi:MAG: hypothetical protein HW386_2556 [Gammaproteobacteria bacterium]|nr:hypothetical protein [Gammaproteobacteria bacterium]
MRKITMFEFIPNWHPIFVHYTVALLSLAVGFYLFGWFMTDGSLKKQFETLADWNLWLGTGFGFITATASCMTLHRMRQ